MNRKLVARELRAVAALLQPRRRRAFSLSFQDEARILATAPKFDALVKPLRKIRDDMQEATEAALQLVDNPSNLNTFPELRNIITLTQALNKGPLLGKKLSSTEVKKKLTNAVIKDKG